MAKTHKKNNPSINWGTIKNNLIKRDTDGDVGRFRERVVADKTLHRKPKHRNQMFDTDY